MAQKYSIEKEPLVGWAKRSGPIDAPSMMGPQHLAHPTCHSRFRNAPQNSAGIWKSAVGQVVGVSTCGEIQTDVERMFCARAHSRPLSLDGSRIMMQVESPTPLVPWESAADQTVGANSFAYSTACLRINSHLHGATYKLKFSTQYSKLASDSKRWPLLNTVEARISSSSA